MTQPPSVTFTPSSTSIYIHYLYIIVTCYPVIILYRYNSYRDPTFVFNVEYTRTNLHHPLPLQLFPRSPHQPPTDPDKFVPPTFSPTPPRVYSILVPLIFSPTSPGSAREHRVDPNKLTTPTFSPVSPVSFLPGSARDHRADPCKLTTPTFSPPSPGFSPGLFANIEQTRVNLHHLPSLQLLPGSVREHQADPWKLATPIFSPVSPGSAHEHRADPIKLTPPTFSPASPRVCSRTSNRPE
ncbi:hypothetical protein BYT27DRAFT_7252800 [Phlegmacium glaucopus]|nr:hypothetical protein BYT27DRAFT_7252800 [Phlegmacium glaucopus]